MSYNPPKLPSQHGAPMGRASYIDYIPTPKSCTLQKVNMTSDGAYDTGGAYWGQGAPLYHYGDSNGVCVWVRAWDRDEALKRVQSLFFDECVQKSHLWDNIQFPGRTITNSLKRKP